jgi:hypothetical protein
MDDKFKKLSFKDFVVVDYLPGRGEYVNYQAHKRHKHQGAGTDAEYASYQPEGDQLDEVMSRTARLKASQRMKRMSKRIQVAKKRAMKRAPSTEVIKKRAQKQARDQMYKKWTRGTPKSDLSISRRGELEKRLKKAKSKVDRMATRLVPQIRRQDRERRANASQKKD